MEHWFDKATKALAGGGTSRREALKTLALSSIASLLPEHSWAQSVLGAAWAQPSPAPAPCTRTSVGGKRTMTVSASATYNGQALNLQSVLTTFGGRFSQGTFYQRIDLGGNILYESSVRFVPGLQRPSGGGTKPSVVSAQLADIRYGPAIRGPRHVILKITEGAVRGFADGHPVSNLQQPEVQVTIDPELQKSVQGLVTSASRNLSECRSVGAPPIPPNPPGSAVTPQVVTPCEACYNSCQNTLNGCLTNPTGWFEGGAVGCAIDFYTCNQNCAQEGGPCCSVSCGGGFCCGSEQSCCGPTGNPNGPACCDSESGAVCTTATGCLYCPISYCCPAGSDPNGCIDSSETWANYYYCHQPGEVCCGQWACSTGQFCADPTYNLCCPTGQSFCAGSCCDGKCITSAELQVCCPQQNVCGSTCCAADQKCLTSSTGAKVCCDQPTLCGEKCCEPPAVCHNGQCGINPCGNTFCGLNDCCNNVCCESGTVCVNNNVCCPTGQACGKICCPSGHSCTNPSTGTCGACASGTSPVRCSNTIGGAAATACCPPNVVCCNGQCCPAASDQHGAIVCCYNVTGGDFPPYNTPGYGCHHASVCTE